MAQIAPFRRRARGDSLAIALALALAALIGWNLAVWARPTTATDTPTVAFLSGGAAEPAGADTVSQRFDICGGGARHTCVVDGDTFWLNGEKIRIADIDTPEIASPRCPGELNRGNRAKQRLAGLLNAGPFTLEAGDRAQDRYGRSLYTVTRGGTSIGATLVDEGLAVWYGNGRPDWC